MTSFSLFAFCTTLKKLNTLMANLLLLILIVIRTDAPINA